MNVIMFGGPLVYCALLFSFDFYLIGSSIYVYMSDLVGRWIATRVIPKGQIIIPSTVTVRQIMI
jgi:hypothetical protein